MIVHNFLIAIRNIIKHKIYLIINVFGLMTGIFILTAILLYTSKEFGYDKYNENYKRIYRLHPKGYGVTPFCFTNNIGDKVPEIKTTVRLCKSFITLMQNREKKDVKNIWFTDASVFNVFTFIFREGNPQTALREPFSIVLTETSARKIFGKVQPMGKTIFNDKKFVFTVTGIIDDLPYNSHIDVNGFISLNSKPIMDSTSNLNDCSSWYIQTYILIKENCNKRDVEKKVNNILDKNKMRTKDGKIPLVLEPLQNLYFNGENNKFDASNHGSKQIVIIYLAIAILTMGIASINYINLSTAKSSDRIKEIAIKKIAGISRKSLIFQFLIESVMITLLATVLSVFMVELTLPYFAALFNIDIHFPSNKAIYFLTCLAGGIILGILSGLYPAIYLSGMSEYKSLKVKPVREGKGFLRRFLVISQFTISIVFIILTFISLGQIKYMLNKDKGFSTENILYINLDEQLGNRKEVLKKLLLQNPEVERVSFASSFMGNVSSKIPFGEKGNEQLCNVLRADHEFIDLLDIKIKEGRNFSANYSANNDKAMLLNETAAKALNLKIPVDHKIFNNTIIGVTKDFFYSSLHRPIEPLLIFCSKNEGNVLYIKTTKKSNVAVVGKIKKICREVNPGFIFNCNSLTGCYKDIYNTELKFSTSLTFYTAIAIILSILGVIGLTLFLIEKKTKEIAIRKINGAPIRKIFLLLTNSFIKMVIVSNIIAMPVAYYLSDKWLQNFAFHQSVSPWIFVISASITIALTYLIIGVITIRANTINPAVALKQE